MPLVIRSWREVMRRRTGRPQPRRRHWTSRQGAPAQTPGPRDVDGGGVHGVKGYRGRAPPFKQGLAGEGVPDLSSDRLVAVSCGAAVSASQTSASSVNIRQQLAAKGLRTPGPGPWSAASWTWPCAHGAAAGLVAQPDPQAPFANVRTSSARPRTASGSRCTAVAVGHARATWEHAGTMDLVRPLQESASRGPDDQAASDRLSMDWTARSARTGRSSWAWQARSWARAI